MTFGMKRVTVYRLGDILMTPDDKYTIQAFSGKTERGLEVDLRRANPRGLVQRNLRKIEKKKHFRC